MLEVAGAGVTDRPSGERVPFGAARRQRDANTDGGLCAQRAQPLVVVAAVVLVTALAARGRCTPAALPARAHDSVRLRLRADPVRKNTAAGARAEDAA